MCMIYFAYVCEGSTNGELEVKFGVPPSKESLMKRILTKGFTYQTTNRKHHGVHHGHTGLVPFDPTQEGIEKIWPSASRRKLNTPNRPAFCLATVFWRWL